MLTVELMILNEFPLSIIFEIFFFWHISYTAERKNLLFIIV